MCLQQDWDSNILSYRGPETCQECHETMRVVDHVIQEEVEMYTMNPL